jgi:hypothetical protein
MGIKSIEKSLETLDAKVGVLRVPLPAIDRWRADAAATLFHLRQKPSEAKMIVAILGGTGTGKSTVVNRLLDANLSASSFKRTFTAGPVAIASAALPENWLGTAHVSAASGELPARGRSDALIIVEAKHELLDHVVLVDTPDLDGDQPAHHAQADRVFRWAQGIIFLVSPEKYQMTELLPYYRLAKRYAAPALYAMNKCESAEMLEDYRQMVEADVFAIPRDDAAYEPPAQFNLAGLRAAIASLKIPDDSAREAGLALRTVDLLGRLRDQITAPLRSQRRDVDAIVSALRSMEAPSPGVDVNPITEQLQRRLQQRSVLYLIGPGRIRDRIRQMPSLLVRLPRSAWDLIMHGKTDLKSALAVEVNSQPAEAPDFSAALADQFKVIQSRIDDCVRSAASGKKWVDDSAPAATPSPGTPGEGGGGGLASPSTQAPASSYADSKINPAEAAKIADDELAQLKDWLQKRWNATPRDTALLLKLLRYVPGGEKLTQWTEAAPYLMAIIMAAHHALFGHIDLMVLGGYSLATWLTERLSNEVASRTRLANRTIAARFARLAHQQIRQTTAWLESRVPKSGELDAIDNLADQLQESLK